MTIYKCEHSGEEVRKIKRITPSIFQEPSKTIIPDRGFNIIMTGDLKVIIAEAFISLEAGMRFGMPYREFSEYEIALVEKKASQMKQEINDFIDSQKQRIIDASEVRGRNGFQVSE